MLSKFGIESPVVNYAIAFVVIFAVLAAIAFVLRRWTGGRLPMPGQDRARARQPRLGVVDVYDLDRQRQLVLLRRDNVEHLLLIGGPNDVVVETNIVRTAPARLHAVPGEPAQERVQERIEPAPDLQPRPGLEPAPVPELAVAARLGEAVPTPNGGGEARPGGRSRPTAPQARIEPALKPDAIVLAPEPPPPVDGRAAAKTAPGPVPAPPETRQAPNLAREARRAAPQPAPAAPPRPAEGRPAAPKAPPAPPERAAPAQPQKRDLTGTDAAVLSDMARQLEAALRQPRTPVEPPSEEPRPGKAEAGAAPARPATRPPAPSATTLPEATPAPVPPPLASAAPPVPAEPRAGPRKPAEEPVPAPAQAASVPAVVPPSETGMLPSRIDPFSIEEIEAEFARLLGRPLDKGDRS